MAQMEEQNLISWLICKQMIGTITEEEQKIREWMARQTTEKVVAVRIGEDASTSRVAEGKFAVEQIEGLVSLL